MIDDLAAGRIAVACCDAPRLLHVLGMDANNRRDLASSDGDFDLAQHARPTAFADPVGGEPRLSGDEDRLCSDVAPVDLAYLPLPDHRHRLEACQRSSRRWEPAEAEPRPNQALDAPVILLHDVVQVFALPQTGPAPEFAIPLHLRDRPGI